jgi:hypothetical protein
MLAQLLLDIGPFEKYFLPLAPPLLLLGELDAMHRQLGMPFLDRLYFHANLLLLMGELAESADRNPTV